MTDYLKVYEKFKHTKEVGDYINDGSYSQDDGQVFY